MFEIIGKILVVIGFLFICIGILGIYRSKNFYVRILSATEIDTMGLITMLVGMAFISGLNAFTFKILLILVILIIINPSVASKIAASAYFSGYRLNQESEDTDNE
jgi:Multisubunit Na+/H+ antiporter, MnhG subunit